LVLKHLVIGSYMKLLYNNINLLYLVHLITCTGRADTQVYVH